MHSAANSAAFDAVRIEMVDRSDLVDEQTGFYVMQRLKDRIGSGKAPIHVLTITPDAGRAQIGLTDQDVATRYDTRLTMTYVLKDIKSGKVLDRGTVRSVTTFGAPFDPYGVASADTFSKQQAAKEVADRLLNTVAAHYAKAQKAP